MTKLVGDYQSWTVSQALFGRIIGKSQQRVSQLIEEDIVKRDETMCKGSVQLIESLKNYYLSQQTLKDEKDESVSYWVEHGLHERAKRELAELKLRERRGELYEASVVEAVLTECTTNFRNKLLGIPAKISLELEGKKRGEISAIISREIEERLEELASKYRYAQFTTDEDEDEIE